MMGSSRAATAGRAEIGEHHMKTSTFAQRTFAFYAKLETPRVPRGIHVMNPYSDAHARRYVRAFLDRYFGDNHSRVLVFGINPGRFGAGVTGVTFTDPVALADECGIANALPRKRELSSIFVYDFIRRFGGPGAFYRHFFLTAASPLGFTRLGLNYNYYDDPALAKSVTPFITSSMRRQIALGARTHQAIVFGAGANHRYLQRLNEEHRLFDTLVPLDHPRFIMQYRRKKLDEYLDRYAEVFARAQL
jgi:hypothetical protein